MTDVFEHPSFDDHNSVTFVRDHERGLNAIIAIHRYGNFAAGGIRMQPYADTSAALSDVLQLSRAMTYKLAVAGLPAGGAKSVIIGNPATDKTPELFAAFGQAVNKLGGAYHCGADVGINVNDIAELAKHTPYTPPDRFGDLSVPTAQGVFNGIRAGVQWRLQRESLSGVSVAVQGLGQVGGKLCQLLADAGCELVIADVDAARCNEVSQATGAAVVSVDAILAADVDVLSPCALGSVLSRDSIDSIKAEVICGAANNQLATPEVADLLIQKGTAYVPDFVANAGGVIGGLGDGLGYSDAEKDARVAAIFDNALRIFALARQDGISSNAAAEALARDVLARG